MQTVLSTMYIEENLVAKRCIRSILTWSSTEKGGTWAPVCVSSLWQHPTTEQAQVEYDMASLRFGETACSRPCRRSVSCIAARRTQVNG